MTLSDRGSGRTAKPLFIGSIPIAASKSTQQLTGALVGKTPVCQLICMGTTVSRAPVQPVVGLRVIGTRAPVSIFGDFQDPQVIEGLGNHLNVGIAKYSSYLLVLTN
jgi:hypothetical protein